MNRYADMEREALEAQLAAAHELVLWHQQHRDDDECSTARLSDQVQRLHLYVEMRFNALEERLFQQMSDNQSKLDAANAEMADDLEQIANALVRTNSSLENVEGEVAALKSQVQGGASPQSLDWSGLDNNLAKARSILSGVNDVADRASSIDPLDDNDDAAVPSDGSDAPISTTPGSAPPLGDVTPPPTDDGSTSNPNGPVPTGGQDTNGIGLPNDGSTNVPGTQPVDSSAPVSTPPAPDEENDANTDTDVDETGTPVSEPAGDPADGDIDVDNPAPGPVDPIAIGEPTPGDDISTAPSDPEGDTDEVGNDGSAPVAGDGVGDGFDPAPTNEEGSNPPPSSVETHDDTVPDAAS